eukprot:COSAG01_NODE_3220_length_6396_cov_2.600762_4_plen_603_part_00
MDIFLDPPYEIRGDKHTRGEARQYMNRYGQVPSIHVHHPLAASAACTKNDTGLSKETVTLLTSCLKCASRCSFTDIATGRSKFFALDPDIQQRMFEAYQHQFLRPAGHNWVPALCTKLHLLLCRRCTPTVCDVEQSCPHCDGSCRKRKMMISDGEPELNTANLEQWLLHFLRDNPYHCPTVVDNPLGLPLLLKDEIVRSLPIQYVGHIHTCRCACRCAWELRDRGQCNCHRVCALISSLGEENTKMSAEMDSMIEVFQKQTEVFEQKESEQLAWDSIATAMNYIQPWKIDSAQCVYKDDAMDIGEPTIDCAIQSRSFVQSNGLFFDDVSADELRLRDMVDTRPRLHRPRDPKTVLEKKKAEYNLLLARMSQPLRFTEEETRVLSSPQFITACRDEAKLGLQCPVRHKQELELLQNLKEYMLLRHGATLDNLASHYPLRIGFAERRLECPDVVYIPCPENGNARAAFISRYPQAAISNCKGDVLCEAVPFDSDLWFDTEKLQNELKEMSMPEFFQQYSTKVQPEKIAECATSQDIRVDEGLCVEKNHAVQDRLTRYLSQLSTLRWFQAGKQLGLSDEQLLQDTRDVGGMLAAMAGAGPDSCSI